MVENFFASTDDFRKKILNDMCELGQRYLQDGNVEAALRWFETAASFGNEWANFELGKMYYYGNGVPEDDSKAAEYFIKSGSCFYDSFYEIECSFGDMFRYGNGVEKNIEKAIFFYEAEGIGDASFALGEIYRDGEGGIQPDGEKAVGYFMETAFNSGDYFRMTDTKIYEDGQNVPMNESERDYFFSCDTSNGDDRARFALAEIYFYGDGCERDIDTALDYYERAADCGNAKAFYRLSQIYRGGEGVKKNLNKAYHFLDETIKALLNKIEE